MSEKLHTIQIDMHTENGENLLSCYYPKEEEKAHRITSHKMTATSIYLQESKKESTESNLAPPEDTQPASHTFVARGNPRQIVREDR